MSLDIDRPIIYVITKGEADAANFPTARRQMLDTIRIAVDEKVSLIQLREKKLPARLLFELAVEAAAITRGSATRLLVNGRADIAVAAKADGVHLAATSLPCDVIRKAFPKDLIIGVSTHTLEEAQTAAAQGADFAVFGPVFRTTGKGEPQGLDSLSHICLKLRPFPIIGIGGIDASNCGSVVAAEASGIAAIRSLADPEHLAIICRRLRG